MYKVAGIYIHIPYCKQACSYCDFYFSTNLKTKPSLVKALCEEIKLQQNFFSGQQVETIYFGGGTPSLLDKMELKHILDTIRNTFEVAENSELTLEANPDNLSKEYLNELLELGINRLSIGLQSFKPNELDELKRTHSPAQNIEVVKLAQSVGFSNITIDLIYGTPWSTLSEWKSHIKEVIQLNIQHISCYQLTIEDKTELAHRVKSGQLVLADDELTEQQFIVLIDELSAAGFDHYEVSNFGKPGFYSRHNSSYWRDIPYLGIGPSAHSYNGDLRFVNKPNIYTYQADLINKKDWFTIEELTPKDKYNDLVLTGLRTSWGIRLDQIVAKLDQSFANYFQRKAQPYLENGQLIKNNYTYRLSEKAFLLADRISADLFYI